MIEKYEGEVGDGANVGKYGDSGADDGDDNGTPPLNPNLQEAKPSLYQQMPGLKYLVQFLIRLSWNDCLLDCWFVILLV